MNKEKDREFNIPCTKDSFYKNYLTVVNGINGLTSIELKVLICFMNIKANLPEPSLDYDPDLILFNIVSKRKITDELKISEPNLNNYISSLKRKKFIVIDQHGHKHLNPGILRIAESFTLTFNFQVAE